MVHLSKPSSRGLPRSNWFLIISPSLIMSIFVGLEVALSSKPAWGLSESLKGLILLVKTEGNVPSSNTARGVSPAGNAEGSGPVFIISNASGISLSISISTGVPCNFVIGEELNKMVFCIWFGSSSIWLAYSNFTASILFTTGCWFALADNGLYSQGYLLYCDSRSSPVAKTIGAQYTSFTRLGLIRTPYLKKKSPRLISNGIAAVIPDSGS